MSSKVKSWPNHLSPDSSWETARDKATQLKKMIDTHNELIFLACTDNDAAVKATNAKIDENCAILEEYLQKIAEIRTGEIDTFRLMEMELNPPEMKYNNREVYRKI